MIDRGHDLPLTRQAELLRLSRSTLYYEPRPVLVAELAIMRRIDELHLDYPFAGSRMLRDLLRGEGIAIGRELVATMMRRMRIEALYRRPITSKPADGHRIYPYLLRGLAVERPNQVWAMDITYIPMARGFVYLAAVVDWFSRRVLAWRLSITLEVDFCVEAVEEALARHGRPEIFNTDQGSQFTSAAFTGLLLDNTIAISMDGRGAWRDNVFVERLWRSVKYEEVVCCERFVSARDEAELYRRWGTAPRSRPAGAGFKPPQAAGVKSLRGERCWKRRKLFRQVGLEETNASEPLMTCRNVFNRRRNRDLDFYPMRKGWAMPADDPTGVRHEGGVTSRQASVRNAGTCRPDAKGATQAVSSREGPSTDAGHRGGGVRSRVDGSVMGSDRRGVVIQLYPGGNPRGDDRHG
jgi:putative transposase